MAVPIDTLFFIFIYWLKTFKYWTSFEYIDEFNSVFIIVFKYWTSFKYIDEFNYVFIIVFSIDLKIHKNLPLDTILSQNTDHVYRV
jgi:hypothetical protein